MVMLRALRFMGAVLTSAKKTTRKVTRKAKLAVRRIVAVAMSDEEM